MAWLRKFTGIGKALLALIAVMLLMFTIGHFGLQYGVGVGDVPAFLKRTWLLWLFVRWGLYATSGYFLWKIYQLAKNEAELTACKKLIRTAVICAVCVELVVFSRLFGG